jgi:hypothetical protein
MHQIPRDFFDDRAIVRLLRGNKANRVREQITAGADYLSMEKDYFFVSVQRRSTFDVSQLRVVIRP